MSGRNAHRRVGLCLGLLALGWNVSRAEEAPGRAGPVYPNFLVEISRDFMNSAAAGRTETSSSPINENKDRMRTSGSQTTSIRLGVDLVPSSENGRVELLLNGCTSAVTDTTRGKVSLGHDTRISLYARMSIVLDENGIHEMPAQTQPHLDMNNLRYLNANVVFPVRPLVKRIAYRVYSKQKPKIDSEIIRAADEQLNQKFSEETSKQFQHLNERYIKDFRQPLMEKHVFPQRIRVLTSDQQLGIRALLNDPTGKPNSFAAVPDVHGWPDVAVRVEESLLNNFSTGLFAGKVFTGEELDDEFNRLLEPLIGHVKTVEAGDKAFTITFAKEKPVEFHFKDQKFSVTLRGEEYTSGGRDFEGMDTTATYRLRKTEFGLIAERQGDLVIYPPGFVPGKDKLGAREKVLQQLLDRKFSKVFKPVFEMNEVKLPEQLKSTDVLVTTQVDSDRGWLTLGWRRHAGPLPKQPTAPKIAQSQP